MPITPPWIGNPLITPYALLSNAGRITSPTASVATQSMGRPGYLQTVPTAGYGTKITRITGDAGTLLPGGFGGYWGKVARHHYSHDNPWNDDMSMIYVEQRKADDGTVVPLSSPGKIILDGSTYMPIIAGKYTRNNSALLNSSSEFRWRPTYPTQVVSWNSKTQIVTVYDIITSQIFYQVHIPSPCIEGGQNLANSSGFSLLGEGSLSYDGRYFTLASSWKAPQVTKPADATHPSPYTLVDMFCVVDIEAGIAGVVYPNTAADTSVATGLAWHGAGVGPMHYVPMKFPTTEAGQLDWSSISPYGDFVVLKYGGTPEYARMYDVNASTLVCTPRDIGATGCFPDEQKDPGSGYATGFSSADYVGWLQPHSHAQMGLAVHAGIDPEDGVNDEALIGGLRSEETALTCNDPCSGTEKDNKGHLIMQRLATGVHKHISVGKDVFTPSYEAEDQHTSCTCFKTPTYSLVTYDWVTPANKLSDEMVIWHNHTTPAAVRLGITRTRDDYGYLSEAHGVVSPGCEKVMFASNWQGVGANPAYPDPYDVKSYVVEPLHLPGQVAASYEVRYPDLAKFAEPPPDGVTENVPLGTNE